MLNNFHLEDFFSMLNQIESNKGFLKLKFSNSVLDWDF